MIWRVALIAVSIIVGFVVATIDAQPMWRLGALACLAWGVYLVFLTVSLRREKSDPCPTCRES